MLLFDSTCMHISLGKAAQGATFGDDGGMASLGDQSQYFEWESPSTATSDSGIVVEQYPSSAGQAEENRDFWLNGLEPSSQKLFLWAIVFLL